MNIHELYQELIIDHGTEPRNCYLPAKYTHHAKGVNPLCGDKVQVYLNLAHGYIQSIAFTGNGCAISIASASIMTELLSGKTVACANRIFKQFLKLVTSDIDANSGYVAELEKLNALAGVREYPSRVKCATLAWHALAAALHSTNDSAPEIVSTES